MRILRLLWSGRSGRTRCVRGVGFRGLCRLIRMLMLRMRVWRCGVLRVRRGRSRRRGGGMMRTLGVRASISLCRKRIEPGEGVWR